MTTSVAGLMDRLAAHGMIHLGGLTNVDTANLIARWSAHAEKLAAKCRAIEAAGNDERYSDDIIIQLRAWQIEKTSELITLRACIGVLAQLLGRAAVRDADLSSEVALSRPAPHFGPS